MEKNQNIIKDITLSAIDVMDNFNARQDFGKLDELADQIHENGLLEPISVIPYTKDGQERYMLVNGERRYRAMKILEERGEGLESIPARMLSVDKDSDPKVTMASMFVQQFVRNSAKPFTDYEEACLYKKLYDSGKTKMEIAKSLGKNPGQVTYYLRMFEWDQRIQDMVARDEIGLMNCNKVYNECKKQYGESGDEEVDRRFTEQILGTREVAVERAKAEGKEQVKATIKDALLYTYVKDTKEFVAGMRVLKQYMTDYTRQNPGVKFQVKPTAFFDALLKDNKLTLKDLFDAAVAEAKSEAV